MTGIILTVTHAPRGSALMQHGWLLNNLKCMPNVNPAIKDIRKSAGEMPLICRSSIVLNLFVLETVKPINAIFEERSLHTISPTNHLGVLKLVNCLILANCFVNRGPYCSTNFKTPLLHFAWSFYHNFSWFFRDYNKISFVLLKFSEFNLILFFILYFISLAWGINLCKDFNTFSYNLKSFPNYFKALENGTHKNTALVFGSHISAVQPMACDLT